MKATGFLVIYLIAMLVWSSSCTSKRGSDDIPFDTLWHDPDGQPVLNLVKNGSLERWENDEPLGWDWETLYGFSSAFSKAQEVKDGTAAIQLSKNGSGKYVIFQEISVEPNTFYVAEAWVKYDNRNWTYGGLNVLDMDGERMGFHTFTKGSTEAFKRLGIKFNSENRKQVVLEIGFQDMLDVDLIIDAVSLRKASEFEQPLSSEYARTIADYSDLVQFDSTSYNENIRKICKFMNDIYIGQSRILSGNNEGQKQSAQEDRSQLIQLTNNYVPNSFLLGYLEKPIEDNSAYCQKSSLSISDILNEFNIPTRQIHMQENGSGFHQFFEYWHPYFEGWIIMDPYYGINYKNADGEFIGYEGLVKEQSEQGLSEKNLVKLDMNAPFYLDELLLKGFESDLHSHNPLDERKSYAY